MPARSIYIRDGDTELWDAAQALSINVSAVATEAVRKAVKDKMTPEKQVILDLINDIEKDRGVVRKNGAGRGLISDFNQARAIALKALALVSEDNFKAAENAASEARLHHLSAKRAAAYFDDLLRRIKETLSSATASS